jgi:iron complex transport system ATP-binding protein
MTLLALKNIRATLGKTEVLHGVSMDVREGELVGLIGPNGAGKSTLLRAALGLVQAKGDVSIAGKPAKGMNSREMARYVAYLPQEREIGWAVSVEMLVSLGRAPHRPAFAALDSTDRALIETAMRHMDVESFRDRPANALSGGERARVLIARALAQDAPLLLADEPTAGLDPAHQIGLMQSFRKLTGEGKSVVVSLHDLGLAARWCTRLVLLDDGKIAAEGTPEAVLTPDNLRKVYGVEAYLERKADGLIVQPTGLFQRN